ncbi:putative uncharacterized protein DDB_G0271606 [Drosophila hydei]|uniref:ALMS motif domain-containing protein n=1 Tax=Drosophila hydei TaxID=7224 RepID=A0A6J1LUC9_DROHY|nr:putative uncharacterized protein DDB_G0271606 [Drosophila hydei]
MSSNNSTNRKQHNDRKLQHTSRITPKIREYLAELAKDRESMLERFMAFSSTTSPASSNVSVGAPSNQCRSRSRSSSMGVATTAACAAALASIRKRKECGSSAEQVKQIPIAMETIASCGKRTVSASVEDLRTPTKGTQTQTPQLQTRKTQTPESALKSHKRLEWDPAADVGYRYGRAISASNISTLERSVLEAAIQPAAQSERGERPNHSESDLNRLQQKEQREQKPQTQAAPLASSTFVQGSRIYSQPQTTSIATPASTVTPVPSQGSRRESCATSAVSSFDYQHNSRPSTSQSNSRSRSRSRSLSAEELLRHVEQQRQEREYAAQLEQVLCKRRQTNKEKRENKENKHSKENKENQQPQPQPQSQQQQHSQSSCYSSSTSSSPAKCDVDLGIDLLCSLVHKRSLSYGQKKQLIRDIAKRLACLDLVASSSSSINSRADSKRSQHKEALLKEKQRMDKSMAECADTLRQSQNRSKDIATNTSEINLPKLEVPATTSAAAPILIAVPTATTTATPTPVSVVVPVPAPRTRLAAPMHSPNPCSYTSTSSGASNELVTQKTNIQMKYTDEAVAEQAAMQEWLNPMTQSEIEYEEKRQQRVHLDTERRTQLNWIDSEILRLRTLQNLLTNAARGVIPTTTGTKSVSIPIQLEEGNGQMPNALNQLKAVDSAEPTAAPPATPILTPPLILVGAAAAPPPPPPPPPPPARVSSTKQLQLPRSKMATPSALSQQSGSSESVCSFVQQRRRQFMAHYQNQQQQRLEQQQQQQQQQLFMRQQQQQQHQVIYRQQQHHHATCHMHQCTHQMQLKPCQQCQQQHQGQQQHQQKQYQKQIEEQQQHQYMEMQYAQTVGNVYGCLDEGATYYHVVNSLNAPCPVRKSTATATATAGATAAAATTAGTSNCTTKSSTSSMLCISSEMSIPLSLANTCEATTTTTTTTTHQYDDVACHQQMQLRQCRSQTQRGYSSSEQSRKQPKVEQRPCQHTIQVRPRSIAYVIQFSSKEDSGQILPETLSLQDYLQRARPLFCAQSKQRKAILNEMQLLRNARRKELEQLIECGSIESLDKRLQQLPPPVTSRVRIFSTREMKALTSKRCENLPEVIAAQNRECEERRRRSNRILRDVFNRRLQRRVRRGKLTLNHSRTVI